MDIILVPVDDTNEVEWTVQQVSDLHRQKSVSIHLLNVQPPLPRHVSSFFSGSDVRRFHEDIGRRQMEPVARALDRAGIPHRDHVVIGRKAESIVRFAGENHCNRILIDERRREGLLAFFGLGSIGSQVRHLLGSAAAPGAMLSGSLPGEYRKSV